MLEAVIAAVTLLVGFLLGFVVRGRAATAEKALLEQKAAEAAQGLATAQKQLAEAQAESAGLAGFEKLAAERERTLAAVRAERDAAREELRTAGEAARKQTGRIGELEKELENEHKNLAEKLALLENAKKTLADQFQVLAGEILEQKSKNFSEASQKELQPLLNPLREQIKEFREKVEQAQSDSKTGVTKLETLIGTLSGMNQQLTAEARNLTTALRGSAKAQGDWGEFVLRDLLERAGLREGEQYSFQQAFTGVESEDGGRARSVRTDVIVSLPGGRSLVIDSKVSLTAYTDCVSAADEEARKAALKLHLASVRSHITGLANAGYHRLPGVEAPDFVVMFVPIEPAFLLALQNDSDLWADAYKQGILLVGPTTLLYVIRIVHVLWQQELQARSVRDVMERGTALYEKFVGFVNDLEAVGKGLRAADQSYAAAVKKLSEGPGNLVRQVEMLKKLGIRSGKSIPRTLLDRADLDEPMLELAAEADEGASAAGEPN
jgi:DNA recombination protein RmuC